MTAPRIIPAAEARALLEAATPGPWAVDERVACAGVVSPALARSPGLGRDYEGVIAYWSPPLGTTLDPMYPRWSHERPGDMLLIAAAPDLAASVVALHEEIKRLRRLTRRQFDDVLDECQEEVKSPSEDLAYADGTVTDRAFTRPVWDMMEEEP